MTDVSYIRSGRRYVLSQGFLQRWGAVAAGGRDQDCAIPSGNLPRRSATRCARSLHFRAWSQFRGPFRPESVGKEEQINSSLQSRDFPPSRFGLLGWPLGMNDLGRYSALDQMVQPPGEGEMGLHGHGSGTGRRAAACLGKTGGPAEITDGTNEAGISRKTGSLRKCDGVRGVGSV